MDNSEIVERVKKAAGGASSLAASLNIHRASVWGWSRIPAERVLDVERITGIPREELRPDLYPRETNTRAPEAA